MRVRVVFFGILKEILGRPEEMLDFPERATVADLLARYGNTPRMRDWLPSLAVAVNQEYASHEHPLRDQDEIGLLPPVSGGRGVAARTCLTRERIDPAIWTDAMRHPGDGAMVVFEGVVRQQSRGRQTRFLEYEAYEPMAAREMEKLVHEALERFAVRDVRLVHRVGRLEIGETSVLIVVAAAHRAGAFDACRWLIDTLKRTVPIWKKEYFADGAVWADGEPFPPAVSCTPASQEPAYRGPRQPAVPEGKS